MPPRVRLLAPIFTVLLAGSLFAQQYPERDHHVFHRPPTPAKHQPALGTGTHAHTASTTSAAHPVTSLGNQSAPAGSATVNPKPVVPNTPDASEHPPQ